jgi:hypothetical protein
MLDSFSISLAMVPKGNVKKLNKTSTNSFPASANKTLLASLFTRSFKVTSSSVLVVAAIAVARKLERKTKFGI